ncbi:MAG: sugar ABC transporter ATP-binding protein, partial [Clostridiales bacterium]|nr:sugar ABC transporter ATP-binding protein [Clostridiales bacterium]
PEDRKKEGLALRLGVMSNMTLVKLPQISRAGFINEKEQQRLTNEFVTDIRVKTPHIRQLACNLSGGNQQKVVISKWLMMNPKILILDEPTRGIDVGSKAEIYGLIGKLAQKGVAVVVVSSEMQEILGICDRIITVFEGRITAEFDRESATDKQILAAALGGGK